MKIFRQNCWRYVLAAYLLLWAMPAEAQKRPKDAPPIGPPTDWAKENLKGRVRSMSVYTQDMDNPSTDLGFAEKIHIYSPKGYVLARHSLDFRGTLLTDEVYKYDLQNRLCTLQRQSLRNLKFPNQNVYNTYNAEGLCTHTRYDYPDSSLWYNQANEYGKNKKIVRQLNISPKLDTFERRQWLYDEDGQPSEELHYLRQQLIGKWLYSYDAQRRLTEKHHYESDGTLSSVERYQYDSLNLRNITEIRDARGGIIQRDSHSYDERQRPLRVWHYEPDFVPPFELKLKTTTHYQHDDVRRTIVKTRHDADSALIDKVISYFNPQQKVFLRESVSPTGEILWHNTYTYDSTGTNQLTAHRHSSNIVETEELTIYGQRDAILEVWRFCRNPMQEPSSVDKYLYSDGGIFIQQSTYQLQQPFTLADYKKAGTKLMQEITLRRNDNTNCPIKKTIQTIQQPPPFAPDAAPDTTNIVFKYECDPKTTLVIRSTLYNKAEQPAEIISFKYNKKRLLLSDERQGFDESGKALPYTTLFEYDKFGNNIYVYQKNEKGKSLRRKNLFDKSGKLPLQQITYGEDGKTVVEKNIYEYTFDKQGNWTRRIYTRNGRVTEIVSRIFLYHP